MAIVLGQARKDMLGATTVNCVVVPEDGRAYPVGVLATLMFDVPTAKGVYVVFVDPLPAAMVSELPPKVPTPVLSFARLTVTDGAPGRRVWLPLG